MGQPGVGASTFIDKVMVSLPKYNNTIKNNDHHRTLIEISLQ